MNHFKLLLLFGIFAIILQAVPARADISRYARGQGHLDLGVRILPSGTSYHEYGDFTLSFGEKAIRTEIGWFGMVGRQHETYGALTYSRGQAKISIGFPRPAYDTFAPTKLIDTQPRDGLNYIWMSGSRATFGVMTIDDYLPYGARYDGRVGDMDFAASIHAVTGSDEVIVGLGAGLERNDWVLNAGLEVTELGGYFSTNAKLMAERQFAGFSVGGAYFHPDANGKSDHFEGYATFEPARDVELSTVAIFPLSGADQPSFGASMQVQIGHGLALRASAISPMGLRDTAGLALRWSF